MGIKFYHQSRIAVDFRGSFCYNKYDANFKNALGTRQPTPLSLKNQLSISSNLEPLPWLISLQASFLFESGSVSLDS